MFLSVAGDEKGPQAPHAQSVGAVRVPDASTLAGQDVMPPCRGDRTTVSGSLAG